MISEHLTHWLDLPVELFDEDRSSTSITAQDVQRCCFRLAIEAYESELSFEELFSRFLANPAVDQVQALVIGSWGEVGAGDGSEAAVRLLVGARHTLKNLQGIFLGDLIGEESEISWINQTDVSPLFTAYPDLEHFGVRGTSGLVLGERLKLPKLKSLNVQTGGMPLAIYHQATRGDFPALERLELWLGTDSYGSEVRAEHLAELLSGRLFPSLRHLGLCDSDVQNDVATAVAGSELVKRLGSLDLSMGTLSDRGAESLLASPAVAVLDRVNLHHHYLSKSMMEKLSAALKNVDLSGAEGEQADEDRYVAVGE